MKDLKRVLKVWAEASGYLGKIAETLTNTEAKAKATSCGFGLETEVEDL